MSIRTIKITEVEVGSRIDRFITDKLINDESLLNYRSILSRSFVKDFVIPLIKLNGKNIKASYKLYLNDIIELDDEKLINQLESRAENVYTSDIIKSHPGEIKIVYEENDYLVLDKQAGLTVHPGVKNDEDTLISRVRYYLEQKGEFDERTERGGIIHRLDKGVSGLILIAKNHEFQVELKKQFEAHDVLKGYFAELQEYDEANVKLKIPSNEGDLLSKLSNSWKYGEESEFLKDWLLVEGFIDRDHVNRLEMRFSPIRLTQGARSAVSYVSYSSELDRSSIYIRIRTGRTHQIRATLKYLGLSIEGDTLYGGGRNLPEVIGLRSVLLGFQDLRKEKVIYSL